MADAAEATISATELGSYAGNRSCPRCAWFRMHVRPLPWQGFPGIFSSIDRYTKQVVLNYLASKGSLPPWMYGVGDLVEFVAPPHWSKFQAKDEATGVTLRGEADAVFRLPSGSCAIVDYKTSQYDPQNHGVNRERRAQLNAYAWIAERLEFPPVTRVALVYMEPLTDDASAAADRAVNAAGLSLAFHARVVEVELDPERLIPPLLLRAARIHALQSPPTGRKGCRDCAALNALQVKSEPG